MKGLWAAAIVSMSAQAAELPRVAPAGPGVSTAGQSPAAGDSITRKFKRRLEAPRRTLPPPSPSLAPSTIRPTPGGAITNSGVPLTGRAGVLRDPAGGLWNCTAGGCFAPDGRFFPLWQPKPPASVHD